MWRLTAFRALTVQYVHSPVRKACWPRRPLAYRRSRQATAALSSQPAKYWVVSRPLGPWLLRLGSGLQDSKSWNAIRCLLPTTSKNAFIVSLQAHGRRPANHKATQVWTQCPLVAYDCSCHAGTHCSIAAWQLLNAALRCLQCLLMPSL